MTESRSKLPERASLEQLRKHAKELFKAFRKDESAALERFRAIDARFCDPKRKDELTLSHANL